MTIDFDAVKVASCPETEAPRIAHRIVRAGLRFEEGMLIAPPTEYKPIGRIVSIQDDGHGPYASIVLRGRTNVNVTIRGHVPYLFDKLTRLAVEDWISEEWLERGEEVRIKQVPSGERVLYIGGLMISCGNYLRTLEEAALMLADRP